MSGKPPEVFKEYETKCMGRKCSERNPELKVLTMYYVCSQGCKFCLCHKCVYEEMPRGLGAEWSPPVY